MSTASHYRRRNACRAGSLTSSRTAAVVLMLLALCWLSLIARILWEHPNPSYGGRDEIKYVLLARMDLDPRVLPPSVPQYPPGWPAVLAFTFWLGGDVVAAHLVNYALLCLGVALVALFWLPRMGAVAALSAALMFAAHRTTINLGDKLLSEPLFLVCLAATLIVVDRVGGRAAHTKTALALGTLGMLCRMVRTAGMAVVGGLVLYCLSPKATVTVRRACCIATIALPLLVSELWLAGCHNSRAALFGGGYSRQWLDRAEGDGETEDGSPLSVTDIVARGIVHSRNLASVAIPFSPEVWLCPTLFKAAGVLIVVLSLGELLVRLWRGADGVAWIVAAYLVLVYLWPYFSLRFFWPIVPWIWYYAYAGMQRLAVRRPGAWLRLSPAALTHGLTFAALAACTCTVWRPALGRDDAMRELQEYASALSWLDQQAGNEQVCVASVSCYRVYLLRPNWKVVGLPYTDDAGSHIAAIRQHSVQGIVERRHKADKYLAGLQRRGIAREVHHSSYVVVYRVDTDSYDRAADKPVDIEH